MTLSALMSDISGTPHGFRSSFRDWAAEKMPHIPDPVAEAALAHKVDNKVVAAFKRTNFLEMRYGLVTVLRRSLISLCHPRFERQRTDVIQI